MRSRISTVASGVVIAVASFLFVIPLLFAFATSFMPPEEVSSRYTSEVADENREGFVVGSVHFVEITFFPRNFTAEQYSRILLNDPGYLRAFWNSVLLIAPILIGQFLLAPLAAYGFEHMRFRYKEVIYFSYIIVMLMPMQILLVPNFIMAGWLGIRESYWAIILPAMFHPLGVFLIRQQIKGFPREVMEAAGLDGAGAFRTYVSIVRPNLGSAVAALVILLFADYWNIIEQAMVFIKTYYEYPLSLLLGNYVAESPGLFFAAAVFYIMPPILVFLLGQEHLTRGILLGTIRS